MRATTKYDIENLCKTPGILNLERSEPIRNAVKYKCKNTKVKNVKNYIRKIYIKRMYEKENEYAVHKRTNLKKRKTPGGTSGVSEENIHYCEEIWGGGVNFCGC